MLFRLSSLRLLLTKIAPVSESTRKKFSAGYTPTIAYSMASCSKRDVSVNMTHSSSRPVKIEKDNTCITFRLGQYISDQFVNPSVWGKILAFFMKLGWLSKFLTLTLEVIHMVICTSSSTFTHTNSQSPNVIEKLPCHVLPWDHCPQPSRWWQMYWQPHSLTAFVCKGHQTVAWTCPLGQTVTQWRCWSCHLCLLYRQQLSLSAAT